MSEDTKKLSAEDILGIDDLEVKEVHVPEWKGSVYLRVLPADIGLELSKKLNALPEEDKTNAMFMLLGECLVGSDGSKLFTSEEQLAKLKTRSQKVLLRLQTEAMQLQGFSDSAASGKGA